MSFTTSNRIAGFKPDELESKPWNREGDKVAKETF